LAPSYGGGTLVSSFGGGTLVPSFGGGTLVSSFGGGTLVPSFGGGTLVPSFGGGTLVPSFGGGTLVPSFGGGTLVRWCAQYQLLTHLGQHSLWQNPRRKVHQQSFGRPVSVRENLAQMTGGPVAPAAVGCEEGHLK